MNNKVIRIHSLLLEEVDTSTGKTTEVRKVLKTAISNIASQIKNDNEESLKLAKAIRFRMSNGATLLEALASITAKEAK